MKLVFSPIPFLCRRFVMSTLRQLQRRRSAFTLIELLVVIAIIGILIAFIGPCRSESACRSGAYSVRQQSQANRPVNAQLPGLAQDPPRRLVHELQRHRRAGPAGASATLFFLSSIRGRSIAAPSMPTLSRPAAPATNATLRTQFPAPYMFAPPTKSPDQHQFPELRHYQLHLQPLGAWPRHEQPAGGLYHSGYPRRFEQYHPGWRT